VTIAAGDPGFASLTPESPRREKRRRQMHPTQDAEDEQDGKDIAGVIEPGSGA